MADRNPSPADTDDTDGSDDDSSSDDEPASPSFSIELEDRHGNLSNVRTTDFIKLAPPMRVQYMKHSGLNKQQYESEWEAVLQHVELPLARFVAGNPAFDLSSVTKLRFLFDQQSEGVVILDDIGVLPGSGYTNQMESLDDQTSH